MAQRDKIGPILYSKYGGLVAQAVSRSPPTAGVPSSRVSHSMWVSWWTKRGLDRFSSRFLLLPQISFQHFSTLSSSISFHFISSCEGATGVLGRHPCYSQLHRISSIDPVLCRTLIDFFIYSILNNVGPTVYEDHMKNKFARLGHSMWVCWWTKRVWVGFSQGFSLYPLPQISIIISPHSSHPFRFI